MPTYYDAVPVKLLGTCMKTTGVTVCGVERGADVVPAFSAGTCRHYVGTTLRCFRFPAPYRFTFFFSSSTHWASRGHRWLPFSLSGAVVGLASRKKGDKILLVDFWHSIPEFPDVHQRMSLGTEV